jgi:hypothetical protein
MYWSPNNVFITRVFMVPTPISTLNEVTKVLNNLWQSGNEHVKYGSGTTGNGSIDPSTSVQGPLPTFNLDVEFFQELQ